MTTTEILTIVFAAVAAVSGIAALIVALARRGGGAFDDRVLREEQKRAKEDIIKEVDYARKSIGDANTQSNSAVANMLNAYLGGAEKKTAELVEYMNRAMAQLAAAEKENAEKTGEALGKISATSRRSSRRGSPICAAIWKGSSPK